MSKKHVVVVMGGISSEHEVSLNSGAMVAGSLDREKYDITPVIISKQGKWKFPGKRPCPIAEAVAQLCDLKPDCAFLALHGPFGEDGRLQGMLDLLRIAYIGSGCAASALAMDKVRSKAVVAHAGIRVARQIVFDRKAWDAAPDAVLGRVETELGFPCVIKSPCQGSSVGMAIPKTRADFRPGLFEVLAYDDVVMVEEYLAGLEITCSVLDVEPGKPPRALPLTEIRPVTSPFFDYYAKYTPGACEEITPARIPEPVAEKARAISLRVHEVIGCRGLSRSDMILDGDEPVWLEVNTIPGLTQTSLFPQAAAAAGISFARLNELFIEAAIAWNESKDA